jgi:hypothetical protein
MDREYIKKHNMMEAHKQFMRLCEGYLATDLSEDEPGQEQQDMPPMDGNAGEQPVDNMNQPADGQQGMEPAQEPEEEPMGPEGMAEPAPMADEPLEPAEDEDVLDVDDLTDAQEKLNKKQNELGHDLGDVDQRILTLLTAVEKIQGTIDKNSSEINGLKAELEKRMPTKTEKLNMQSLNMYPYNVSPKDYWAQKEKEGVYQAEHDSQEDNLKKQFEITQQDVDDFTDREMEDSFDDNEKYRLTMKDIFKGF